MYLKIDNEKPRTTTTNVATFIYRRVRSQTNYINMEYKIKQLSTDPQDFKIVGLDNAISEVSTLIKSGYLKTNEIETDLLTAIKERLFIYKGARI